MALTKVTTKSIKDGEIVNADVNASAAIAGSKIDPDFGSQGITTTGVASIGNGLTLTGTNPYIDIVDSNNDDDFTIKNDNGTFKIQDKTDTADRLAIDSSGNVGIGTTSPSTPLHIKNPSSTACRLVLENTGSGSDDSTQIWSQNNDLALNTNDSERMRIDSSGNVGIGTTSPRSLLDLGAGSGDGSLSSTLSQYQIMFEAPQGTDDYGRNIGWSVGTNGLTAAINAVDVGASDSTALAFITGTNSSVAERMRILSNGGITFNGDTAAANALDDYEEGSWTPSVISGGSGCGNDSSNNRYVKIGSMVYVTGEIYQLTSPDNNTLEIGGLPYAIANGREGTGSCMSHYVAYGTNRTMITTYLYANSSKFRFYTSGNATSWAAINGTQFTTSGDIIVSFAYHTV